MGKKKNLTEIYNEACITNRHYSNIILSIRLVTIIQGLIILGICGKLIVEQKLEFVYVPCLFGLLFTVTLLSLHYNYYRYFNFIVNYLCDLEDRLSLKPEVDFELLWTGYKKVRKTKIYHFGPFILMGVSFVSLLIYSLCNT
jgi:hypothetical protein